MSNPVVEISVKGSVPSSLRDVAKSKFASLASRCREPVGLIEVRLITEPNPAHERPSIVEAVLDLAGRPVRAHVEAERMGEAIDLAVDHLSRRIARAEARLHHLHDRHDPAAQRGTDARQRLTAPRRPAYLARPTAEREVVRRKTFALDPITLDEAAFDLDQLGHDFYLFTDLGSGADCVLAHSSSRLELYWSGTTAPNADGCATEITVHPIPVGVSSLDDAEERLDITDEPFVFFRAADTDRGNVLYRRRDGHYGLITTA